VTADRRAMGLRARLVLAAFLMLFVELALIRWLGANVLYLAYFSNVVLLGSFLGIGLGFLWTNRREASLFRFAPLALGALVLLVRVLDVEVGFSGGSLIFFGLEASGPSRWIVLPVVFVVVAVVMACLGEGVARCFQQLSNLDAYQLDLIGSFLGVVAFALLSLAQLDPVVWASITAIALVVLLAPRSRGALVLTLVPLAVFVGLLAVESGEADTVWTPYYKVGIEPIRDGRVIATVNGIPTWLQEEVPGDNPLYRTVYERQTAEKPGRVLIIGAGSGNDVALAGERGATAIDAVEIDPHLLDLGRDHPLRPYDDPRVRTHVTDGRAFLEASEDEWDLILLALPDSLTLLQGQSSVRLESYLFTKQAAEAYRDHLADGGVFAMYNYYREPWLVDRYARTLEEVFGEPPCVDRLHGEVSAVLVVSEAPDAVDCPNGKLFDALASAPEPATDDHPFPYLRVPSVPSYYLIAIAFMLGISVIGVRVMGGPIRGMAPYADLFCMGVAFLLLETKNVVQFALLFGTTWFVNAFVFGGVLLSVLLAIAVSKRVRLQPTAGLYGILLASIALNWVVPASVLLELDTIPRLVAAVSLAFCPIFLANLVFASRFRETERSTAAFGANLLGAMVGGLLEYTSLIVGYRNLLLVVAAFYAAAFALRPRQAMAAG
jgi:hypothetical protein